jgi:hypothetical protein
MTAQKTSSPGTPAAAKAAPSTSTAPSTPSRKPWIKKTPVEIVLEQIGKQEEKVADMRKELAREERELTKLQQAKKVLEAQ